MSEVTASADLNEVQGDPVERITNPHPALQGPVTPLPDMSAAFAPSSDQAIHKLNEAAQYIADIDPNNRRSPRASRLSPIRDISADIRRESTPMPDASSLQNAETAQKFSDLWPWIQELDPDESMGDSWANRTDPLISRHIPSSAEAALIEEEDIRRAISSDLPTGPLAVHHPTSARMRVIFTVLVIMAIVALIADATLLSVVFVRPHSTTSAQSGPPTLTLSQAAVHIGQTLTLRINHFFPGTHALLSHDIQEPVRLADSSGSLVQVGANGTISVSIIIDNTWGPGFHIIQAEDVTTRYTVSATLQIIGAGQTQPSQLVLSTTGPINMGSDYQGTNTNRAITLRNTGGGSITWQGNSSQPWLLLSPPQGLFSAQQSVAIVVQRAHLKPKQYKGTITFTSNTGTTQRIQIEMNVRPLPANAGPVIQVIPAALSFTATDGGADPAAQFMTLTNIGTRNLSWSAQTTVSKSLGEQSLYFHSLGPIQNWLDIDQSSGVLAPNNSRSLRALVHSHSLLPGIYTGAFIFTGPHGVLDNSQEVVVSLTILPRCGVVASLGNLSFTMVAGRNNPGNQSLNLAATSSCSGTINWQAVPTASWITATPANGQLRGTTNAVTAVGVNATGVRPGVYNGAISFTTGQNTQTVMVHLVIQPPPPPNEPIMSASPLSLNFSATAAQSDPPGQIVTITNTGGGTLYWHTTPTPLAPNWLSVSPTGGSIPAGETGQMLVNIHISGLTPNTYMGQISINGADARGHAAGGNPQALAVSLIVQQPCVLAQPSTGTMAFNYIQGGSNPSTQPVTFSASGNCGWPLSWSSSASGSPAWLTLTPNGGSLGNGQTATLNVGVNPGGLAVGTYTTTVSIDALDSAHLHVPGSPQSFTVTLSVQSPCTLVVPTSNINLSVSQGQRAPATNITYQYTGACSDSISMGASTDSGSNSWLSLGAPNNGTSGGTIPVQLDTSGAPGTYTGQITLTASGSIQNASQTVSVSLTITGFSISGTVMACADTSCVSPPTLPGATVTLKSSDGTTTIATTTADGSGNYSFSNIALNSYMIVVSGTDSDSINYTGSVSLTVNGDQSGVIIDAFPG